MWVARARWAQVWVVVKLSGEGTQYCIVGGWWVMSQATSSVQRRSFQFDKDGLLFTPLSDHLSSLTAESWPEELTLLCCAICLWRGCFVSPVYKSVPPRLLMLGVLSLGWISFRLTMLVWSELGYEALTLRWTENLHTQIYTCWSTLVTHWSTSSSEYQRNLS